MAQSDDVAGSTIVRTGCRFCFVPAFPARSTMADASAAPRDRPLTPDQKRIEIVLQKMKLAKLRRPFRSHRGRVLPQHLWMTAGMALDTIRTSVADADVRRLEESELTLWAMDPHWEPAYGEVVCSVFELEGNPRGFGACNRVFRAWDAALELRQYADRWFPSEISMRVGEEQKRDLDAVKALLVRAREAENTFFTLGTRWRRPWAEGHDDF